MRLDERGFVEAPGFVLLFLLSLSLGIQALIWQKRLNEAREHHRQVLCLKRAVLINSQLVRRVGTVNQMLAAGKVGQGLGLLFPGVGWIAALKWERAKKVLMGLQETSFLDAQKELLLTKKDGCRLLPLFYLTPYKHHLKFERRFDIAKTRSETMTIPHFTPWVSYIASWKLISDLSTTLDWEIK